MTLTINNTVWTWNEDKGFFRSSEGERSRTWEDLRRMFFTPPA